MHKGSNWCIQLELNFNTDFMIIWKNMLNSLIDKNLDHST